MKRENDESIEDAMKDTQILTNGTTNNHENEHQRTETNGVDGNEVNGTTSSTISSPNEEKQSTKSESNTPSTQIASSHASPTPQGFHNVKPQENVNALQNNEIVPLSKPTTSQKKKEIYRYTNKDQLFACAWSNKTLGETFRLAVCTCKENDDNFNKNQITIVEYDEYKNELVERCTFDHGFPASAMLFNPSRTNNDEPEIIATATNGLKLFKYDNHTKTATLETTLTSKALNSPQECSPFTGLDWLELSPEYIGTSCVDSTCSIWNIEYGVEVNRFSINCGLKTQLIAHEKSVNSIAFSNIDREQFVTASEDGSVRLFDTRNLQTSTILYDDPKKRPLNHVAWNKKDQYTIAILPHGSPDVLMIDIRKLQSRDSIVYNNHNAVINSMAWAPHSEIHICTVGVDHQALIWQTDRLPREEPILAYKAAGEISQVKWSKAQSEWIVITFDNNLEILRV